MAATKTPQHTSTPTDTTTSSPLPQLIHKAKSPKLTPWSALYVLRGLLCLIAGLLLSSIFFIATLVIWALNKMNLLSHRRAAISMCHAAALTMGFLFVNVLERVMGVELEFSGDEIPVGENAIIIGNHVTNIDVACILAMQYRKGMVGHGKFMSKEAIKHVPFFGWAMNLMGQVFLKRNWEKDKAKIESAFNFLLKNKVPVQLVVLPEGTRITEKKRAESLKFAEERGIDVPLYQVLLPRPKGFCAIVEHMQNSHLTHVYDMTFGFVDGPIRIRDLLLTSVSGKKILVNVKRVKLSDLPVQDEKQLQKWLMDRFQRKDKMISSMKKNRCFEGEPIVRDPMKFRLV